MALIQRCVLITLAHTAIFGSGLSHGAEPLSVTGKARLGGEYQSNVNVKPVARQTVPHYWKRNWQQAGRQALTLNLMPVTVSKIKLIGRRVTLIPVCSWLMSMPVTNWASIVLAPIFIMPTLSWIAQRFLSLIRRVYTQW